MASITVQHQEELLSVAYMTAVASRAGLLFTPTDGHDYGVDGHLDALMKFNGKLHPRGYVIQVQLKACVNATINRSEVSYVLDVDTYNYFVQRASSSPRSVPLLLVLLCLPKEITEWTAFSEDGLYLRRCCYWTKLQGESLSQTKTSKTIKIPRSNQLTPTALQTFMTEFEEGKF